MTIGTLFTLFVVPSVYVLIAKDHHAEVEAEIEAEARVEAEAEAVRESQRPL